MHPNKELIDHHSCTIEARFSELIPKGVPYALVDFPDHPNVGDSAIWVGEIRILSRVFGQGPRYTCTTDNYSAEDLRSRHPEGPILIHGGGNFGDIWMRHQRLREQVIKDFKDRAVVQLPQTVHFNDASAAHDFAHIVKAHGNVHILTRDHKSFELAKSLFGERVELCPDSAFGIGAINRVARASHRLFSLLRDDAEKSGRDFSGLRIAPDALSGDWLEEPPNLRRSTKMRTVPNLLLTGGLGRNSWRNLLHNRLAQRRVDRGLATLSQGKCVITDRLHAHILCVLMGIPNIVLDNNYGKVHGYIDAWTSGAFKTYKARSADEALALLEYVESER